MVTKKDSHHSLHKKQKEDVKEHHRKIKVRRRKKRRKSLQKTSELTEHGQRQRRLERIKERVLARMPGRRTRLKGIRDRPRRRKPRTQDGGFSASGDFGTIIGNVENTISHSVDFFLGMLKAVEYAIEMPSDLYYHTGKESQPTTQDVNIP